MIFDVVESLKLTAKTFNRRPVLFACKGDGSISLNPLHNPSKKSPCRGQAVKFEDSFSFLARCNECPTTSWTLHKLAKCNVCGFITAEIDGSSVCDRHVAVKLVIESSTFPPFVPVEPPAEEPVKAEDQSPAVPPPSATMAAGDAVDLQISGEVKDLDGTPSSGVTSSGDADLPRRSNVRYLVGLYEAMARPEVPPVRRKWATENRELQDLRHSKSVDVRSLIDKFAAISTSRFL